MPVPRVVIAGAGIAGLCCARRLAGAGVPSVILEASDAVGGGIRTDVVEGFRLDRGFQVLLSAYPELDRFLTKKNLKLRRFEPGAMIHLHGRRGFSSLHDVLRKPSELAATLRSSVATTSDLRRTARLKCSPKSSRVEDLLLAKQTTSLERLDRLGFSHSIIEAFFKPFFGGVPG